MKGRVGQDRLSFLLGIHRLEACATKMSATMNGERLTSTELAIAADTVFIYIQARFEDGSVLRSALIRSMVEGEELPLSLGARAFDPVETLFLDEAGTRHYLVSVASSNTLNLIRYGSVGQAVVGTFRLSFEGEIEVSGRFDGTRGEDQTLPSL